MRCRASYSVWYQNDWRVLGGWTETVAPEIRGHRLAGNRCRRRSSPGEAWRICMQWTEFNHGRSKQLWLTASSDTVMAMQGSDEGGSGPATFPLAARHAEGKRPVRSSYWERSRPSGLLNYDLIFFKVGKLIAKRRWVRKCSYKHFIKIIKIVPGYP
jgi:hypothetical protein